MDTQQFAQVTTSLAAAQTRRQTFRLIGAAVLGGAGLSLASESDAKRGKRRNNKKKRPKQQPQDVPPQDPPTPDPFVDIAITALLVEPLAEAGHDNLVVQYVNNGTLDASGFRIGMTAKRTNGQIRNEVFSLPITLAAGQSGSVEFRLGCAWLNEGTVTARTDPSPVPGEVSTANGNNILSQTFGAAICS